MNAVMTTPGLSKAVARTFDFGKTQLSSRLLQLRRPLPARPLLPQCRQAYVSATSQASSTNASQNHQYARNGRAATTATLAIVRGQGRLTSILVNHVQKRNIFGEAANTNGNLAYLEEVANRQPNSVSAQNAFYEALARANKHAIIVERYKTGRYASNAVTERIFNSATGAIFGLSGSSYGNHINSQGMDQSQISSIATAVAAQMSGANVGKINSGPTGMGAANAADKSSPMYVVVDETIGNSIFKWVKALLYFGLTCYVVLAVLQLLVEGLTSIGARRGLQKGDNEAKAEHQTVRFSDVHGCDEAKEELQELVDFLKNPDKFSTLGGKLPKGVLLVGPPGTGKTLLARAVAGEAGVPFFFMSGSEFDEIYVGVGAKRVRELFSAAKGKSPAIIFIDELDAIGGKRNARDAAYVKQTLNQLLTELDGFEQNSGVIILAATNFPEMLDKALTRPGRFDRNVTVGLPDVRGRMAILKHHMKNIKADADVSVETIAAGTPGFSGAELENVVNQAAVRASKAKAASVTLSDFEWAKDKVMMGAEKRSMIISAKEREMTAYHEAGHALVVMFTEKADKLHKITIMPRGQSLGMTMHLPEVDKYSMSMNEYAARIDVCLGGKIAEEMIYGSGAVTSGCASDLTQATRVAYAMVTQFGMSDLLGNVDLNGNYDKLSAETKRAIESEVRRTIAEGYERATNLLRSKKAELELLAKALVAYETLDREEAFKVIRGEKLDKLVPKPQGPMKIPEMPSGNGGTGVVGGLPGVLPIPGSKEAGSGGGSASPPPPIGGGVVAP